MFQIELKENKMISYDKYKYSTNKYVFALLILLILPAIAFTSQMGKLSGQVFIVTKGGDNIKLGLVNIYIYSENVFKKHIEKKKSIANSQLDILNKKLEPTQKSYDIVEKEHRDGLAKFKADHNLYLWTPGSKSAIGRVVDNKGVVHFQEISLDTEEYKKLIELEKKKNDIYGELQVIKEKIVYFNSGEFYFMNLPSPITTGKTDADGTFSLKIPGDKRVALLAHASREVFRNKEEYYWMLWVSLKGGSSKRILLSNDNMIDASSPDSIITLPN